MAQPVSSPFHTPPDWRRQQLDLDLDLHQTKDPDPDPDLHLDPQRPAQGTKQRHTAPVAANNLYALWMQRQPVPTIVQLAIIAIHGCVPEGLRRCMAVIPQYRKPAWL